MSLASILAVACLLLAPSPRDLGAYAQSQAEEPKQESPPPAPSFPVKQPPVEASEPKHQPEATASNKKAAARKKAAAKKPKTVKVVEPPVEGPPERRVIRNGSATDPTTQISPSVPPQKASSQMENTNSLLSTADANLKSISGAQLSASQEDMVKQVKTYMEQAKTAAGAGDLERANNLATKAQLLSAELVKK